MKRVRVTEIYYLECLLKVSFSNALVHDLGKIVRLTNFTQDENKGAVPEVQRIDDTQRVKNQIPPNDRELRRKKLKKITQLSLDHLESKKSKITMLGHEIVIQEQVKNAVDVVMWAESVIKEAVKDVPYASLAWAGVSLILPLLKNPSLATAANAEGFTEVNTKMRYFNAMECLLFPKEMTLQLKEHLEECLVDLYHHILDFLLTSVLRYYRSSTKNYFTDVYKVGQWKEKLESIQDREKMMINSYETACTGMGLEISSSSLE
jgi:hypothetical protein